MKLQVGVPLILSFVFLFTFVSATPVLADPIVSFTATQTLIGSWAVNFKLSPSTSNLPFNAIRVFAIDYLYDIKGNPIALSFSDQGTPINWGINDYGSVARWIADGNTNDLYPGMTLDGFTIDVAAPPVRVDYFIGNGIDSWTTGSWTMESGTPVPEPSSLTLLGIGLVSLIGIGWRHSRG